MCSGNPFIMINEHWAFIVLGWDWEPNCKVWHEMYYDKLNTFWFGGKIQKLKKKYIFRIQIYKYTREYY